MMIARWSIDARFGCKQAVVDLMQRWLRDVAPQAGLEAGSYRMLTGSVGTPESTLQIEHQIEDLATLEQVWARLPEIPAHQQWGKDLEPYVVSGSNRWEILRVLS